MSEMNGGHDNSTIGSPISLAASGEIQHRQSRIDGNKFLAIIFLKVPETLRLRSWIEKPPS
jgi:hypothetical protein